MVSLVPVGAMLRRVDMGTSIGRLAEKLKRVTADNLADSVNKGTHAQSENKENYVNDTNQVTQIDEMAGSPETPSFISISKIPSSYHLETYAGIISDPKAKGGKCYKIIEPSMTSKDWKNFELIQKMLMTELSVDLSTIRTKKDAEEKLIKKIREMVKSYHLEIPQRSLTKIIYYAIRNFIHLEKIEAMMHDHMIEEISCDGTNIPLYIWHREHESMPTNVIFETDKELENFTRKLAYVAGKHISVANPIVDASLPDGSRVNLTFGREITKRGSTFTIRKFKADPITVIDLIKFNTLSSNIAAFLWYAVEKQMTMLVAGGTASGKTTSLNILGSFITPAQKIVSIEDTAELNLPHENWIASVSRETFTGGSVGEITQFDLLRSALRQRPDVIIIGETRGKEAFTLFQAMATGHGGFSSIHADSIEATTTRLTSTPMNVPNTLIAHTLDLIILQLKLKVRGKSVRRVMKVSEIVGIDKDTKEILFNDVFNWNAETDQHVQIGKSRLLEKIAADYGETFEEIQYEIRKRKSAIDWMVNEDIREHKALTNAIMEFYANPEKFYDKTRVLT